VVTDPLVIARCVGILRRRGLAIVTPHALQLHQVPASLLRVRTRDTTSGLNGASIVVRLLVAAVPGDPLNRPGARSNRHDSARGLLLTGDASQGAAVMHRSRREDTTILPGDQRRPTFLELLTARVGAIP
jgi:hypothetical protein